MNDRTLAAIEQVFDELDAETTTTHYPTDEIVTAINRRMTQIDGVLKTAALASALLTTFYAGALWRERTFYDVDGGSEALDLRATLLASARAFLAGAKSPDAKVLADFLCADVETLWSEDRIVDADGKPIFVGARIGQAYPPPHAAGTPPQELSGRVLRVIGAGEREGGTPIVEVVFDDTDEDEADAIETTINNYGQEGPDEPYTFVADEIRVL